MKKILIIGHFNNFIETACGQTTKTLVYKEILEKEGFNVVCIDLTNFKRKSLSILTKIRQLIKNSDIVLCMPGPRGCHLILPYVAFVNKKYNRRLIYCAIGTGLLSNKLGSLSIDKTLEFYNGGYRNEKGKSFLIKTLNAFDVSLFETQLIVDVHKKVFNCNKVACIENFRIIDDPPKNNINFNTEAMNILFLSRMEREKGLFDLCLVVKQLNDEGYHINLDIYGEKRKLQKEELTLFNSYLSQHISYKGLAKKDEVISIMSTYHLFCFPTKHTCEGTPGVISESFIAGTPILCSDFFQAKYILEDGKNAIFYKMNNIEDLKSKIIFLYKNRNVLKMLRINASEEGKKYIYSNQRSKFIDIITGANDEVTNN